METIRQSENGMSQKGKARKGSKENLNSSKHWRKENNRTVFRILLQKFFQKKLSLSKEKYDSTKNKTLQP